VIDAPILAAFAGRLRAGACAQGIHYRPLYVAGVAIGLVDDVRAARLAGFDCFHVADAAITLDARLSTCAARSAALAEVALTLRSEGALPAWRDELFAIAPAFGRPALFVIERGAARYFGFRTAAAHVNGVTQRNGETIMWLARRSRGKAVDPGLLDNLVGGGIAAGFRVDETVVKEAWEEAGIDAALARTARPAGLVHSKRVMSDGLQRESLFVHDLVLPPPFVPVNQDGEAVEHRLVSLDEAARTLAATSGPDELTLDASAVVLDYLIRHGRVQPDQPGYADVALALHRRL
jgi:8-oxo-dGTP pyrophosphatase MutT (NUDIX family)